MDIKEILFNCITLGFSGLTKLQESQAECEQLNDDLGRVRNELEICRRKSHQLKDLASKKIKELHQYALGLESRLKRWQLLHPCSRICQSPKRRLSKWHFRLECGK